MNRYSHSGILSKVRDLRLVWLLFASILGPVSMWILESRFSLFHNLELIAYDWHLKSSPSEPPDARLVLVGMDDQTLGHLGLPSYPLPRSIHGKLVSELERAGARVIGFDVMFTNAAPELLQEDEKFQAALKHHGNVFSAVQPLFGIVDGHEELSFIEPDYRLRSHLQSGAINVPRSFGSSVRAFQPSYVDQRTGKRYLQLATLIIAGMEGADDVIPEIRGSFKLGSINAPLGQDGEVFIRYIGPPGSFKPVPMYTILDGSWKTRLRPNFFKGKTVLVGRISSLEDRQLTPMGEMQGCEILLNAAQTLLRNEYISRTSVVVNFILRMIMSLIVALVIWKRGLIRGWQISTLVAVGWISFTHLIFISTRTWFEMVSVIISLAATLVLSTLVENYFVAATFQRFMPSWVAQRLLTQSESVASMTTSQAEISVVFCDIRGFTSLSEELSSDKIENLMSLYYSAGERMAMQFGTQLDKFVGDEIMLYFDDFERSSRRQRKAKEHHAIRAVRWALSMQSEAIRIHSLGATDGRPFQIGIGICTGIARVGLFGGEQRKQHTVYGDTVNIASRLQNATKETGKPIVISESTYIAVRNVIDCEPIGSITVKGKREPLVVHCPLKIKVL